MSYLTHISAYVSRMLRGTNFFEQPYLKTNYISPFNPYVQRESHHRRPYGMNMDESIFSIGRNHHHGNHFYNEIHLGRSLSGYRGPEPLVPNRPGHYPC